MLSQGIAPSVQKIREVLGTGSNTTIAEHLKVWREEYAKKTIHYLPPNMPKELIGAFEVLWQTVMEYAQNQLAEYKLMLDGEPEIALQQQRNAEKMLTDVKHTLTETAHRLENLIIEKQNITIELSAANDRLTKQEEMHASQKNQYEERLNRAYSEKDVLTTQAQALQSDIKSLQEQLVLQSTQHQNQISQQHRLHEQSENRWIKLIDEAKQEIKEANKKLENMRCSSNEQIEKLSEKLSVLQQNLHEKNLKLEISCEQITQLKQDIKALKEENFTTQSTIMKLSQKQRLENLPPLIKKKIKNKKHLESEVVTSS